jgi:hypothetical protein
MEGEMSKALYRIGITAALAVAVGCGPLQNNPPKSRAGERVVVGEEAKVPGDAQGLIVAQVLKNRLKERLELAGKAFLAKDPAALKSVNAYAVLGLANYKDRKQAKQMAAVKPTSVGLAIEIFLGTNPVSGPHGQFNSTVRASTVRSALGADRKPPELGGQPGGLSAILSQPHNLPAGMYVSDYDNPTVIASLSDMPANVPATGPNGVFKSVSVDAKTKGPGGVNLPVDPEPIDAPFDADIGNTKAKDPIKLTKVAGAGVNSGTRLVAQLVERKEGGKVYTFNLPDIPENGEVVIPTAFKQDGKDAAVAGGAYNLILWRSQPQSVKVIDSKAEGLIVVDAMVGVQMIANVAEEKK